MLVIAKSEYMREHKVGKRGYFDTKLAAQNRTRQAYIPEQSELLGSFGG